MTAWTWPDAEVTRVVDGDTIIAHVTRRIGPIDVGFHATFSATIPFDQRLRLDRINASPAKTERGKAATTRVQQLVAGVSLTIVTVGAYKYGDEWMAELVLPDGRNVADLLLAEDLVDAWDGKGPRPGGRL